MNLDFSVLVYFKLVLSVICGTWAVEWDKIIQDENLIVPTARNVNDGNRTKRIIFPPVPVNMVIVFDTNIKVSQAALSCATLDAMELVVSGGDKNPITTGGTNIGIVTYDTEAYTNLILPSGNSVDIVNITMMGLKPIGGANRRERGLNRAYRMLKYYGAPKSPKYVVVYVHDPAQPLKAINVAGVMRSDGVQIIVVAFGPNYDNEEALGMVGPGKESLFFKITCPL